VEDGDGSQPSSNGVWVKNRRIWLGAESKCKVGDILLSVSLREEHSLQTEQCVSLNRSTDGSLH
jgi:hypothetical protein